MILNLTIDTSGPARHEITDRLEDWLRDRGDGVLTLLIRHTSASLLIQENADPNVMRDLKTFFKTLVKEDPSLYRHGTEGPDDMPAHIKSAMTQTSLNIPVTDGRMALGTWQGIYLFEHRTRPHKRQLTLHLMGD